jgi:dTDP-4-amino-4,6-dideoxygalactose transaminase
MEPIEFIDLQAQRRRIGEGIDKAIARVLDHGRFIMGPEVADLEDRLTEFCGARHVVTCASGTDALLLALLAWGVGTGDAVFLPAFTFASTAEVVALLGAVPVFVDIRPETFDVDPASLAAALDGLDPGLRPAGVIAVDLFGHPADYAAVETIAARHGLWVLADAAQSFGATLDGRRVGTIGDIAATSFFPAKPLGCYGDGGAVLTSDDRLADVLRSLRVHGQGSHKYDVVRVGINGRLDTIQAAVLLEKLTVFADELRARDVVAARYTEALADCVGVPRVRAGATSSWAQYTIRVHDRDRVAASLRDRGIPTAVYYPKALHEQAAYAECPRAASGLAEAERAAGEVLSLPMHPYLEPAVQDAIVAALREAVAS